MNMQPTKIIHAKLSRHPVRLSLALLAALLLAGCGENDLSDLQAYAEDILSRKGTRIAELPPVELTMGYIYNGGVDPFEPFFKVQKSTEKSTEIAGNGLQPNFDRNKEELENFALDSLRMLGTLELDSELWAIIRSPDGTIHRTQTGNFIGHNHGKIIAIYEDSMEINEIVPDSQGGWQERTAGLALIEQ